MSSFSQFLADNRASRQLEPIPLDEPVPLDELHTPALIIDLDAFDKNLSLMQGYLSEHDIALRAHTKMHKCPIIAKKQVEQGARGVCAAKVSEAELMADGGVEDILITSPVVSEEKARRVIELAVTTPGLKIVVDNEASAGLFNELAKGEGISLGVFVDIDPGMGRTGIEAGEPVLALVQYILDSCTNLKFCGLQMYAGNCMHVEGFEERSKKYQHVMEKGLATRELFAGADIDIPIFSGGGTGTYNIEPDLGLINELQAGSYAFMDIEYRDIGGAGSDTFNDFAVSLFVLVTAISKPQERLITVDGGFKSFASDQMAPEFRDIEGVIYHWGGDEHGIVQLNNPSGAIELGHKLPMLTPHCDPTVNLHDYYYPYRDGVVSEIWPIAARGCSQ